VSGRDHAFSFETHPAVEVVGQPETKSPAQVRRIAFGRAHVAAESVLLVVEMEAAKDPDLEWLQEWRFLGGRCGWRAGLGGQRRGDATPAKAASNPAVRTLDFSNTVFDRLFMRFPPFLKARLFGSRAAFASARDTGPRDSLIAER